MGPRQVQDRVASVRAGAETDLSDCIRAEEALRTYSEQLEAMIEQRTRALQDTQAQLLEQERLQRELELAEQVQRSLLPRQVPILEGFDVAAAALPAHYVSGDLYDFVLADSQTCHIILADISGKGVPAALLALTARTLFRAETGHETSPAQMLRNVNASFYPDLDQAEMFITFLAARLDASLGSLTYASAGHGEIVRWQHAEASCHRLPATGLPIGVDPNVALDERTLALRPGDVVVFYSDGITEAANTNGERYGPDRLMTVLSEHASLPAAALAQAIVDSVEGFRGDTLRSDDLTIIVLKALPRTLSFTHPATWEHLRKVCALVRQASSAYGEEFAYEMELAACEIVSNVIRHAYGEGKGELRGRIAVLAEGMELDLYDDGCSFDYCPAPAPEECELQEGGYGLVVARELTDALSYAPCTPEGNHWHLAKHARGGEAG
jgi:serine phosphatase RsbU (regulator of sigma subunit)/anti-sigma regulatory factor (Ser/Thr protein kinase)